MAEPTLPRNPEETSPEIQNRGTSFKWRSVILCNGTKCLTLLLVLELTYLEKNAKKMSDITSDNINRSVRKRLVYSGDLLDWLTVDSQEIEMGLNGVHCVSELWDLLSKSQALRPIYTELLCLPLRWR